MNLSPENSHDNHQMPPAACGGGVAEAPPANTRNDPPDPFEIGLQRIDEHLSKSLIHMDPVAAIVGAESAELMRLQLQFNQALHEALGIGRVDAEILVRCQAVIEMMLKISKQVAQYTRLHQNLIKKVERPPTTEVQSEETPS